jgi:hypothetical protein
MEYTQEISQNNKKILISKTLAIVAITLLVVDIVDTFIAQGR